MAPSRKSRSVNRRLAQVSEVSPNKRGENAGKFKSRKRKLADMLGPRWSKEELERFYKSYRKHGKDWDKVAAAVRGRSVEMVEALYTMNQAYLSLPKGYASATGLIAMMTDHYSNLGDSDSEHEVNDDAGGSQRPQKRARGTKGLDRPPVPDPSRSQSAASNYGCLSLLKKRRSGTRPWSVGKRTPRVPVSFSYDKDSGEKFISPVRRGFKGKADAVNDDVAHEIAVALTEASQRGGSPQVSCTPNRKMETPSPAHNGEWMHADSEMNSAKLCGSETDEDGCELSLGSTGADLGNYARDKVFLRRKRYHGRKLEVEESVENHLDDIKEACSGTEEGQKAGAVKGKFEVDAVEPKGARSSHKGLRKRSKKVLFEEGEFGAFDALEALADLSLRFPETHVDTESSVQVEEDHGIVAKSSMKGTNSPSGLKVASSKTTKPGKDSPHNVSAKPEAKEGTPLVNTGLLKRRQKPSPHKISENKERTDSYLGESRKVEAMDDVNNLVGKAKRNHDAAYGRQFPMFKPPEHTSSSTDRERDSNDSAPSAVKSLSANQLNLPTKVRSRRKINTPKPLIEIDSGPSQSVVNGQSHIPCLSYPEKTLNLKEILSHCLSWYQVRRWCIFEWFYSAIDYPWFAKREFVEYLDHVGLGHIPRLTRVEWGVIRSSLGKPRRFSEQFLKEEKEKLYQYRESVRRHYTELWDGTRDGLPTDLARPLSVGQRIIALHPRTREIHDGSVLTVDHNKCRVQFDRPELGVEFVMDIDCMPLNPLENMPAYLARQNVALNKFIENANEIRLNGQPMERKMEGCLTLAQCENLENSIGLSHPSPLMYDLNNLFQQEKGYLASYRTQVNASSGTVNSRQAAVVEPPIVPLLQAKEADVQALSEVTRALDKKEALLAEWKHLNDEVFESQKDSDNSLKDSEPFKKHYAAVVVQLNEATEQLSSALFCLRQRNTYQGHTAQGPPMSLKPMASVVEPLGRSGLFDHSADETQESGSQVAEIVETSRTKAQTMVDAAMQAMTSLKKEGSNVETLEEVVDYISNQVAADDLNTPAMISSPANPVQSTLGSQDQMDSCVEKQGAISDVPDTELNISSDQNEAKMPSELISQCVATFLMIQKCTERQFPPSDVAQVLDSAVTSLKPYCPQNFPIYAEIQKCMGIIRNQILALVPT